MIRRALGACALLLAAGCDAEGSNAQVIFACGETRVVAAFEQEAMVLTSPQGQYRLPRVRSGSGAKYEGPEASFWEHQGRAMVVIAGETLPECTLRSQDPR